MRQQGILSGLVAALSVLLAATAPGRAEIALPPGPACSAPSDMIRLGTSLSRTRLALADGEPVVIVAVGSSSTSGHGASTPARSYPARLQAELRARLPGADIKVLNRGVGGEEAAEMLGRFSATVIAERPDLVLWQVGTNAVLRNQVLATEAPLISEGIRRLKAAQADLVLIDAQYAPEVLAKPDIHRMVDILASKAGEEKVGLFRRFAIMQHWKEAAGVPFGVSISEDGLHMNDWSYACFARLLAVAITDAVRIRPVAAGRPTPGAVISGAVISGAVISGAAIPGAAISGAAIGGAPGR